MRLFSVLLCLSLVAACGPAPQPAPLTASPSPFPPAPRTTATETEKRLDSFIAAKGKRLGKQLIDALKNYLDLKGTYPESLELLVTEGLLPRLETSFDVTDFDTPRNPEIERFVFDGAQPKIYRLEYQREQTTYALAFGYSVLDVVRHTYKPEIADWGEQRAF